MVSLYEFYYLLVNVVRLGSDLIVEVWSVERAFVFYGVRYTERFLYVESHFVRRCCSESDDGCVSNLVYDGSDASVFRSEVVSPFRDAVCFVNGIERYLHSG